MVGGRVVTFLCLEDFVSEYKRDFVGEHFCVSEKGIFEKISQTSVENCLSHSSEKLRRGTLHCFRSFLMSKVFLVRGGGLARFVDYFLSHGGKSFRRGTLRSFRKFMVSKNYMLTRWRRRLCHALTSNFCFSHSSENLRREPFGISQTF